MEIQIIEHNKKEFLDLLLLADEDEHMIDTYLERGTLFALYDDDLKSICVVTQEGDAQYELQNLATYEHAQGKGYGKAIVKHAVHSLKGQGATLIVGTGDIPWIVSFYESCGFALSHRLKNYFVEHYDFPMFEDGIQLRDKVYLQMVVDAD